VDAASARLGESRATRDLAAIAVKATQLGREFHGDPADRLIVATAILEAATLVTKDERIREYPAVTTVW
jgi:PIN domain nuclease of toxin-antitoxin system